MCLVCVSTMSSRCMLFRAPNPSSQSIFNLFVFSDVCLFVILLLYASQFFLSILFLNFFLFFLPLDTIGIFIWCITFILLLYSAILKLSILFLNFFIFFTLSYQWDFYWYLTSILLLYASQFFLSILF